jgi:hypothetical protein
VLALGHSARDTFEMLHARGVFIEAKPFSIGFRIEHPQSLIDRPASAPNAGHPLLGAADYKLVHHASNGRSVYSFCMCPGGTVVAATSEPGRVVTNGMSQYSRNERNANAGIVVGISPPTTPAAVSPLAGIAFQRHWEARAFELGGGGYARRRNWSATFIAGQPSTNWAVLPSYKPGVHLTDLATALPDYAIAAIREALPAFGRQIRGFAMARRGAHRRRDAHLVAAAHHPRRRLPEPEHPRPVPGRRRRGLRRRHLSAGVDGIITKRLQPHRKFVRMRWHVQDASLSVLHHDIVVSRAEPARLRRIIQRVGGEQSVYFKHRIRRQRLIAPPLELLHRQIVVVDHALAMIPGCPATAEHLLGNCGSGSRALQLRGSHRFLDL